MELLRYVYSSNNKFDIYLSFTDVCDLIEEYEKNIISDDDTMYQDDIDLFDRLYNLKYEEHYNYVFYKKLEVNTNNYTEDDLRFEFLNQARDALMQYSQYASGPLFNVTIL